MPGFHAGRGVRRCLALLLGLGEAAEAETYLNGVNAGIRSGEAGVRDVHEADLGAPIVLTLQEVSADGAASGEIDARRTWRRLIIGEERAAAQVDVGRDVVVLDEIPLQREGIQAESVGGPGFLDQPENWDDIDGILEASTKRTGSDGIGEDPAVAQTYVPYSGVGGAAVDSVAAAGPNLQVMAAAFRAGLGAGGWGQQNNAKYRCCENAFHPRVSSVALSSARLRREYDTSNRGRVASCEMFAGTKTFGARGDAKLRRSGGQS